MSEFWMGMLAIPAIATAGAVAWFAYTLAHYAWRRLHEAMVLRVKLRVKTHPYGEPLTEQEKVDAGVDRFAVALKAAAGKCTVFYLLGVQIAIVAPKRVGVGE